MKPNCFRTALVLSVILTSLTASMPASVQEADKEANWLPAPAGDFWVVFRTYGPGPNIVDQTWKLPPLELTK